MKVTYFLKSLLVRSYISQSTMKKQNLNSTGQKKLTQFFSKKVSQDDATNTKVESSTNNLSLKTQKKIKSVSSNPKQPLNAPTRTSPRKISPSKIISTNPEQPQNIPTRTSPRKISPSKIISTNPEQPQNIPTRTSPRKISPSKIISTNPEQTQNIPTRTSPRKLSQSLITQYSPSKETEPIFADMKVKSSPVKPSITKKSPKKSANNLKVQANLISSHLSSLENIEDRENDDGKKKTENVIENLGRTPKKRKFTESPLKEKKNGDEEVFKKEVDAVNESAWGDEIDFTNLPMETIVMSPNKGRIKKLKFSENPRTLNNPLNKSQIKNTQNSDADLSHYFSRDVSSHGKRAINFEKLDRYEVVAVNKKSKEIQLILKNINGDLTGTCFVRSPWDESSISVKDIVSVKAVQKEEGWVVDWSGLLVLNPDRLISGTTIVGSVYCTRKTVLSHLFKEPNGRKDCLIIGSVVHELFQEALKQKLSSLEQIKQLFDKTIVSRDFLMTLFLNDNNYEEIVQQINTYLKPVHNFVQEYVFGENITSNGNKWNGQITQVEDIEENIWSPILGIKGKVDATVEVRIHKKNKVLPLELKTGKPSFSIEHRGQVILYCMLLQQLQRNVDSGLLLYLNPGVQMQEIKCEEREVRDLTLLRNGLDVWLSKLGQIQVPEKDGSIPPPLLPPPINRRTCQTCPYLTPCSAALRGQGLEKLGDKHHLKEFGAEAIKHLTEKHIDFVFHWLGLLLLEKNSSTTRLSDLWSMNSELREKSGKRLAQLKMDDCVNQSESGFKATFSKLDGSLLETEFTVGQLLIVSSEDHMAIALGLVKSISPISIALTLDKSIKTDKAVTLDAYESDSTFSILTNNLSCLLENNPRSSRLRELIIDQQLPNFSTKVSGKLKKIGLDIFERLNREQVRAVLQAVSSENYILIKGMPGTGKTRTMAALIELLTRLKKRVLVTSFTHSAIDNILINLIGKVKMLRLGTEHRIHPKLQEVSENYFLKNLKDITPAAIESVFSDKEVVGVTCYGCKHPWIERQVFDVCLVDEAGQVSLPAVIKPISLSERFILVGDSNQLPPLIINEQAKSLGLGKSLFEMLERPAVTAPLTLQYRMNREITALANSFTYEGQLQCADDSVALATLTIPKGLDPASPTWLKESLSSDLNKSVILLDVKSSDSTDVGENKSEASVVQQITGALLKGGIEGDAIGVIATYSKQVTLLKSLLQGNVEVNTVDQYQGRDKDIIIYSATRTCASAEKKDILSDWNRLTVAITRAKKKLIILGNVDILSQYENFGKLILSVPTQNISKVPLNTT